MSKIYSRKSWTATSVFFQISVSDPWWFIEPPRGCHVSKCCTYCTRTSAQALNVHLFLHVHCPAMPAGEVKLQGAEWGVPVFLPEQSKWKWRWRVFSTIAMVQQGKASDLKWLAGHPETNQTCSPVGDTVSLTYGTWSLCEEGAKKKLSSNKRRWGANSKWAPCFCRWGLTHCFFSQSYTDQRLNTQFPNIKRKTAPKTAKGIIRSKWAVIQKRRKKRGAGGDALEKQQ